jgi:peptide deformylase
MKDKIITIEDARLPAASVLKQRSARVNFPLSSEDKEVISTLKEMLFAFGGTGLAAPQINVSKNIAAIYIPQIVALIRENAKEYPLHVIINAEYEPIESEGKDSDFEACYSIKSTAGKVSRYKAIKLQYQTEEGEEISEVATGVYARVMQHEIDHLNGVLITDRLTKDCFQGPVEEIMRIRKESLTEEKRLLLEEWILEKGGKR